MLHCVAVGFDRSDAVARKHLTSGEATEMIFEWPAEARTRIRNLKIAGATAEQDLRLHMVGYALELAYDLALGTDENVSRSFGFEGALGAFRGHE